MGKLGKELLEGRYHRIYLLAHLIDQIAAHRFAYLQDLEAIFADQGIYPYLPAFQKESAVHRFAGSVLWQYYYDKETLVASAIQKFPGASIADENMWVLPVEAACEAYEIEYPTFVEFRKESNLSEVTPAAQRHFRSCDDHRCTECARLSDEYLDYWNELNLCGYVDDLLDRTSEEVFFVMFSNRSFLANLHGLLSGYVQDAAYSEEPEIQKLFEHTRAGSKLKRATPPAWAKRAVEFRDRGRCVYCHRQLGTLHTPINHANFDHIIPLAQGGLNDVTNLQLLCDVCNNKKRHKGTEPGRLYERWYPA
ncbi:HNH endonuclease signature motif containing protein [Nonomuraea angiospora]|uniref:HNH endonuclease n=1 Tax=Nonomuraea angiospora TaxID=46172 RepID=UPI0033EE8751